MLERRDNKEYLPIEGLAEFRKATIDLMLGPNSKAAQEVSRQQPHGGLRRGCERRPPARRNSNESGGTATLWKALYRCTHGSWPGQSAPGHASACGVSITYTGALTAP